MLDDEFSESFGMTDNQLGESEQLDTTKFRQAIWNYIHRLHGIFHDDYDYQEACPCWNRACGPYEFVMMRRLMSCGGEHFCPADPTCCFADTSAGCR